MTGASITKKPKWGGRSSNAPRSTSCAATFIAITSAPALASAPTPPANRFDLYF